MTTAPHSVQTGLSPTGYAHAGLLANTPPSCESPCVDEQPTHPPRSFDVPYGRPLEFSDPYNDFTPKHLAELLQTPDEQWTWHHFVDALGPHLPAGEYTESVYFLPRAFDYILEHDKEAFDLITPIVGFVSQHTAELDSDGLLTKVRECLFACLRQWTSLFTVVHYDLEMCKGKGWRLPYYDLVTNSELICVATSDLVEFRAHRDIAETFAQWLAHHSGDPLRAAWFLEYARARNDVHHPPAHGPIQSLLSDQSQLEAAALIIRGTVAPREKSPTYWRDTFKSLGL
jgi:hypothetical protein